ncbi:MAG: M48 family metalloprotease, partial [Desulfobacteraceae bacterium]
FSTKIKSDTRLIDKIAAYHLEPSDHNRFAAATYKQVSADFFQRQVPLPAEGVRSSYSSAEQGLGVSIAGKVGSLKLMEEPALTRYINQVGNLVVAASSGFDLPFAFFIIDDPKAVNAYACPGGYIFVTRGLLSHIKNEAELAAILAHEVAHVTHQHGLREIKQRRPMIVAENAFAELDEETGGDNDDKWKAIEEDLDQFALDAYETIFNGRLSRYELDADRIGLIYTARSGYDPKALIEMLQRLKQTKTISTNEHYTSHNVEQRLQGIEVALNAIPSNGKYFRFADRWRKNTMVLK